MKRKFAFFNHAAARMIVATVTILFFLTNSATAQEDTTLSAVEQIQSDVKAFRPLAKSEIGNRLLDALMDLPEITSPRVAYYNRETRDAMTEGEFAAKNLDTTSGYAKREFADDFYYFTRYGTPVAFTRALDLVGTAGLASLSGARICEYGFGTIGQLHAMAASGADVTGIEVDKLLRAIYSAPTDTGIIARIGTEAKGKPGHLRMLYGLFPGDSTIMPYVGGGYDLFISKNTLKRGYVHPEKEVDPRMLVHLGVDDSTFVKRVYDLLKPGGYFMIYNLHPKYTPPTAEKYVPWSDGRSPFDKSLYEQIGFEVLAFDLDDTKFAHEMAKAFGWDADMDLENDLFGMYTLMRKK